MHTVPRLEFGQASEGFCGPSTAKPLDWAMDGCDVVSWSAVLSSQPLIP